MFFLNRQNSKIHWACPISLKESLLLRTYGLKYNFYLKKNNKHFTSLRALPTNGTKLSYRSCFGITKFFKCTCWSRNESLWVIWEPILFYLRWIWSGMLVAIFKLKLFRLTSDFLIFFDTFSINLFFLILVHKLIMLWKSTKRKSHLIL